MEKDNEIIAPLISSFWEVFHIIFVIFSLYLTGDILYRWDGFMYYGSFSDFLPGVALITIIWSSIAMFTAMFIWLLIKSIEILSIRFGRKINVGYLLINIYLLLVVAFVLWFGNQPIANYKILPPILKKVSIVLIIVGISWLFRNKAYKIQKRITPLVWLYGILLILSFLLLGYHIGGKQSNNEVSKKQMSTLM